jgi:hypothetical protein
MKDYYLVHPAVNIFGINLVVVLSQLQPWTQLGP